LKDAFSSFSGLLPRVRAFPLSPQGRDRFPRVIVVSFVLLVGLFLVGSLVWRLIPSKPPVAAYSEVATALELGLVERLRIEGGGTRLVATLRDGPGLRTVGVVLPAGALDLVDLERWSAAGAEVEVVGTRARVMQWFPFLALIVIGVGVLLSVAVRRGSGRRFRTTPLDRRLTLADVGGSHEAADELRDVIAYLRDPSRFDAMGAVCPRGVLLVGPPGTGKTMLARAVAGESGVPVIVASGSEFAEMYVGVGARRVRDLARQARKRSPCIVFIDEFDSVGGKRGRPNRTGEEETTLNQLLVEMDGMASRAGVVWMAATNREDMLDPAVRRPGRFDRVVEVGLPSTADRLEILRVHAGRRPLAEDVDLSQIAGMTVGYSGADLANLLNEAAIIAVQAESPAITRSHLEQARDKIMLGRVRTGFALDPGERRLIALHEAGHAVVGLIACPEDRLHKVTIEPRGRSLGAAHFAPDTDRHLYSRRYLDGVLAKALGGRAAELVFLGPDAVTSGAGSDLIQATGIARRMVAEFGMSPEVGLVSGDPTANGGRISAHLEAEIDRAVRALIEAQAERAERIVRAHAAAVGALASALEEQSVLHADEVITLVRSHGVVLGELGGSPAEMGIEASASVASFPAG